MGRLLVLCPRCHTDQVMQGSRTTVHIRNTTTDGFVAQLARRKEQAMPIPESVRALMTTGPQAHLTTLNPDGSPQVTMVWVGLEDDEFVMGHLGRVVENLSCRYPIKIPWVGCILERIIAS